MAFVRPSLASIVERVQSDFVSRLNTSGAVLRRAVIYVLSRVIAGAVHMLHGHLDYLSRQLFPDLSDDPFLVRQAGLFGITKTPASFGQFDVEFSGTDGNTVPTGTVLRGAEGFEYTTDADATIASGVATTTVTAELAGDDPNIAVNSVLSFESPVSGVDSTATVTGVESDGSAIEDTEGLRTRFLARLADPPHGGNLADYVEWAKEVPGVTRVFPIKLGLGPGTVLVYFARDNDPSPIPDSGEVAAVQAVFDELAPAHATAVAAAPSDTPQSLTIHLANDTTANRALVTAALTDFYKTISPVDGVIYLSRVRTTIGDAVKPDNYTMSHPTGDVLLSTGQLPRLGTITWT